MIFESLDGRYKNGGVANIQDALTLAYKFNKLEGFKLYDANGCFISEYRKFDGKYREVANA